MFVMLTAGGMNAIAFFALSAALKHITVTQVNLLNSSQTAMAAIAAVRASLGYRRIVGGHFIDNPASGRVMQKIGMQLEADGRPGP